VYKNSYFERHPKEIAGFEDYQLSAPAICQDWHPGIFYIHDAGY